MRDTLKIVASFSKLIHICRIRDITKEVAAAVIKEALEEDLAEGYHGMDARELRKLSQVIFVCFGKLERLSNNCGTT